METIELSGHKFKVAIRVHPTKDNEISWTTTIRPSQYGRIGHLDIVALRKAYDKAGYPKEFYVVLQDKYSEEYPCATFFKDDEFVGEAKENFLKYFNDNKIGERLLRRY